jgi:hypothetical protein
MISIIQTPVQEIGDVAVSMLLGMREGEDSFGASTFADPGGGGRAGELDLPAEETEESMLLEGGPGVGMAAGWCHSWFGG